ncbi:MAG: hypothetical protein EOP87_14245, partial [Verrucomicrobiaceae bacterium]
MILRLSIVLALAVPTASAEKEPPRQDLLRFSNGDQLHGSFAGIGGGAKISWDRKDVAGPIEVSSTEVRQVVLNGGRPRKPLESLSCVTLVEGDRIPGVLRSLDDKSVVLETSFAGMVTLPRDRVAMVAPSPLGGRLIYHGPYEGEEWSMINMASPDGLPPGQPGDDDPKDDPTKPGHWKFSGSAWYWQGTRPGTALIRREGMPDRSVLRFNLAWKNRMSMAFAFHADFRKPKPPEDEVVGNVPANQFPADASSFPRLFGNSYVLQLSGNSVLLYRSGFDEQDKPTVEAIRSNSYSARLGESDNVTVELRCNRQSGEISLFINDEFFGQWSEGPDGAGTTTYAGKGGGFGFMVQSMNSP